MNKKIGRFALVLALALLLGGCQSDQPHTYEESPEYYESLEESAVPGGSYSAETDRQGAAAGDGFTILAEI